MFNDMFSMRRSVFDDFFYPPKHYSIGQRWPFYNTYQDEDCDELCGCGKPAMSSNSIRRPRTALTHEKLAKSEQTEKVKKMKKTKKSKLDEEISEIQEDKTDSSRSLNHDADPAEFPEDQPIFRVRSRAASKDQKKTESTQNEEELHKSAPLPLSKKVSTVAQKPDEGFSEDELVEEVEGNEQNNSPFRSQVWTYSAQAKFENGNWYKEETEKKIVDGKTVLNKRIINDNGKIHGREITLGEEGKKKVRAIREF